LLWLANVVQRAVGLLLYPNAPGGRKAGGIKTLRSWVIFLRYFFCRFFLVFWVVLKAMLP